jgi:hypothetical protein
MPDWAKERKQVGDRAEMYSVQMERMKVGATSIVWVARDDDGLADGDWLVPVEDDIYERIQDARLPGETDDDTVQRMLHV